MAKSEVKYGEGVPETSESATIFRVHPRRKYDEARPNFKYPRVIGDFSLNEKREYSSAKKNLYFLDVSWEGTKKVQLDLTAGLDRVITKNTEETKNENLKNLLTWILCNRRKFYTENNKTQPLASLSTDFVCYRGLLTELLRTPYEKRDGWIICATRFRGTIYLCAFATKEKLEREKNMSEREKNMASWGYKFEQLMAEDGDPTEPVNENPEYCCVLRSRLKEHSIVYGAELDGVDRNLYKPDHSDLSAFVELKTSREVSDERGMRSLENFKMIRWWAQSYLVGVPRLVCGFRTDEGVVKMLESFKISELPRRCQSYWRSNICMNFCSQFLSWVKDVVSTDDPKLVYKFEREPNGGDITCTYLGESTEYNVLPAWFTEAIFKCSNIVS